MKWSIIGLTVYLTQGICYCQTNQNELLFKDTFDKAKYISDSLLNFTSDVNDSSIINLERRFYKGFNFKEFKFINGVIDSSFYYVGYYKNGKLVKIRHYESVKRLSNFEIQLFEFDRYILFGLRKYDIIKSEEDEGYGFIPGFFVFNRLNEKIYFVNTYRNFNVMFESFFPIKTIQDVWSIALINDEFCLTNVFHFSPIGKLDYYTQIVFEEDKKTIKKERKYYYNSKVPKKLVINERLTFEALDQYAIKYTSEYIDTLPCIRPENKSIPLWVWANNHRTCDNK